MHNSIKAKTTSLMVLLVSVFLLSALVGVNKVSAAGAYDWPMFHHDLQHTGYSASPAPSTNQTLWSYTTGASVYSSPAVTNGVVYVGSMDDNVYALDAATGALIWNYTTGGDVFSNPAVADGKVYVGSKDDKVYCMNAADGALLWNYTTGGDVLTSPAVANGRVFVGSDDKNVYCLNAATGGLIWNYITGSAIWSSPAVANGVVYIGSYDKKVYAFSSGAPIPEGLTIGVMLLLATVAVIVSPRYFRKRPKIEN